LPTKPTDTVRPPSWVAFLGFLPTCLDSPDANFRHFPAVLTTEWAFAPLYLFQTLTQTHPRLECVLFNRHRLRWALKFGFENLDSEFSVFVSGSNS